MVLDTCTAVVDTDGPTQIFCGHPAVATVRDPIWNNHHRNCHEHATLMDRLDDASRETYALVNDPRSDRPRLVVWDVVE